MRGSFRRDSNFAEMDITNWCQRELETWLAWNWKGHVWEGYRCVDTLFASGEAGVLP